MTAPQTQGREQRRAVDATLIGLRGRSIDLPAFSGPLDLLLGLIRRHEIDIYDIPIAVITEQYLEELLSMEQRDLTVAGDFLLMAATLLEIKSAMLLPRPAPLSPDDEGDPRAELVQRLLEYQAVQQIAEEFAELEQQRRSVYSRPFTPFLEGAGGFRRPISNLSADRLLGALHQTLERLAEQGEPVSTIRREILTLRMRLQELMVEVRSAGDDGIELEQVLHPERGRWFVIVSFLAVLELMKAARISVEESSGAIRLWTAAS